MSTGFTKLHGTVLRVCSRSILFRDEQTKQEVFLPASQIRRWGVEGEIFSKEELLSDVLEGDAIFLEIPDWLAEREFLK